MHNMRTTIYRQVAITKALMIAMCSIREAAEYLKEHGFTCWEAIEVLVQPRKGI